MILNFVSSTPLYKQIHAKISTDIRNGRYNRDVPMPSVRQFSRQNSVSITVVERAYRQLMTDGWVTYVKGEGYYASFKSQPKELLSRTTEKFAI